MAQLVTVTEFSTLIGRSHNLVRRLVRDDAIVPVRTKNSGHKQYRLATLLASFASDALARRPANAKLPAPPNGRRTSQLDSHAVATAYLSEPLTTTRLAKRLKAGFEATEIVLHYGLAVHYGYTPQLIGKLAAQRRFGNRRGAGQGDVRPPLCTRCDLRLDHTAVPAGNEAHCGWCLAELAGAAPFSSEIVYTAPSLVRAGVALK